MLSSISTGETESFKFIFNFWSSTSEAISIKYFELKLILRFSELKSALIFSFPSPEFALLTESWILSLLMTNLTPSFLSKDTEITLSIELMNSFLSTMRFFLFSFGITFE